MPVPSSDARRATIALLAASIPLQPDLAQLRAQLNAPHLDWNDFLYLTDGHGITPLLYCQWREFDLLQYVPDAPQQYMAQAYADNATRNNDARREFIELLERLKRVGVECIVLKGLPLLFQLYSDPAQRVLYDFDLLVKNAAQARRGWDSLIADGFTSVPTPAAVNKHLPSVWRLNGFVRRGYLFDVAQPRPVELHLTLWDREWRGLDVRPLPEVWAHSGQVEVEGITVRVLSPEDTLIHLCEHLATHLIERGARLGQVIDIARMLEQRGAQLSWERIVDSAEAAQVARFVYLALCAVNRLTHALLPPPAIVAALRDRTPRRLREWAEQHSAADLLALDFRQPDLSQAYMLTFAATQSWREKARVLRFAFLPSPDTLQEEYGGHGPLVYARHIGGRGRVYLNSLVQHRAHH